ncbi:hypothetical protein D3C83_321370 [compost metagenome]
MIFTCHRGVKSVLFYGIGYSAVVGGNYNAICPTFSGLFCHPNHHGFACNINQ